MFFSACLFINANFLSKTYHPPETDPVGFADRINEDGYYELEFFPLKDDPHPRKKLIKYFRHKEFDRMVELTRLEKFRKVFAIVYSYIFKARIPVWEGA